NHLLAFFERHDIIDRPMKRPNGNRGKRSRIIRLATATNRYDGGKQIGVSSGRAPRRISAHAVTDEVQALAIDPILRCHLLDELGHGIRLPVHAGETLWRDNNCPW